MAAPATLALERCPVCGGQGGRDFALGDAALRECASCGAVHSRLYADPDAVYVDGYYSGDTEFGIDVRHPRFQAFLAEVNAHRAALLAKLVGEPLRVLDVGCGTGDFLAAGRERGWTAVGVDPIEQSGEIARGRGLDVRTSMLEDSGVPPGEWDVVSAFHVLEHVPDAAAFLRLLASWVRPGGYVLVESPNWDSQVRLASGDGYVHLRPLEHLIHLTPDTVRVAMQRAGLEPAEMRTPTWPSRLHTPQQALADVGRWSWSRLPGPLARAAAAAARAADARRGRGMVVWGLARVPAG
ncbi:MAG TPA: class I SAM-dependent methyltransferase [Solirubrobacteraceae bacterium]|nr:class I SAM-dependent methyltransferase [Solirubrobacteraceae bacterium]